MPKTDLKLLLHPYFLVNFALSLAFVFTKLITPICHLMYRSCEIEMREYELLVLLVSFVTLRKKRQATMIDYIAHFCMFAKVLNAYMFWRHHVSYAVVFGLLWLLHAWLMHLPVYKGPECMLFLRDSTFEAEVMHGDPRITWIVSFYTIWSPICTKFAPIFSELSYQYGLSNLKFAKIDITRYPEVANKMDIDTSAWSSQIPTVIMFRAGKELDRRPGISSKRKVTQKFFFTWENMINSFNLNNLHMELKKTAKAEKEKKKTQ